MRNRTLEQLHDEILSNGHFIKLLYLRTLKLYEEVIAKQAAQLRDHESESA